MQGLLEQQLKNAIEDHREVTLVTGDSRLFSGIVVESIAEGFVTGQDADRSTVVLEGEMIKGAIVHDRTPNWYDTAR